MCIQVQVDERHKNGKWNVSFLKCVPGVASPDCLVLSSTGMVSSAATSLQEELGGEHRWLL